MITINDLRKFAKTPYQRVSISNAEIWANRKSDKWHIRLPAVENVAGRCVDARCPFDHHPHGPYDNFDPWAIHALLKLKKGLKVLVLFELGRKQQVAFFTFDHFDESKTLKLCSQEISSDLYFFVPTKDSFREFGVMIDWVSIKYLAIVNSKEPAFGRFRKSGGGRLYAEELSRLTGESRREVRKALQILDSKNQIPFRPKLKNPGIFLDNLWDNAQGSELINIDFDSNDKSKCDNLAFLFLFLSENGKLAEYFKKLRGWVPENIEMFSESLEQAFDWYLAQAPTQKKLVACWQKKLRKGLDI